MKRVIGVAGLLVAGMAGAAPEDQINRFLGQVPEWGEPARQAAVRQQYDREVEAAQQLRWRSAGGASSKRKPGSYGALESTYSDSSGYESHTYRNGGTYTTIRMNDGKVTGTSTYQTR